MISNNTDKQTDRQTDVTKDLSFETWKLMHVQDKDQRVAERQKKMRKHPILHQFFCTSSFFPVKKVLVSGHDM